jgi:hypothetical protein
MNCDVPQNGETNESRYFTSDWKLTWVLCCRRLAVRKERKPGDCVGWRQLEVGRCDGCVPACSQSSGSDSDHLKKFEIFQEPFTRVQY